MSYIPWGTILKGLMNVADTWLEYTDEDSRFYKDKKIAAQRMVDPLGSIPTKMMGQVGLDTEYRKGDEYPIDDWGPLVEAIGNMGMGGMGSGAGAGAGAAASSSGWGQALGMMGGWQGLIGMLSNAGRR